MKIVSFEIAKYLKEVGYPQNIKGCPFYNEEGTPLGGDYDFWKFSRKFPLFCIAPTYLEVWLWLWREKNIRFDIEDLWDANLTYPARGCASCTNQLGGICTPEVSDPEEAIIAAVEYLAENNLIE